MRGTLLLATLVSVGACTLAGVGDGLDRQDGCTGEPLSFCDELNAIAPSGDDCLTWQCSSSNVCELLRRDDDGDGAVRMGCVSSNQEPDCDDDDANRSPLATEICDGVDNDCNEISDDGAFTMGVPTDLETDVQSQYFDVDVGDTGATFAYVKEGSVNPWGTAHAATNADDSDKLTYRDGGDIPISEQLLQGIAVATAGSATLLASASTSGLLVGELDVSAALVDHGGSGLNVLSTPSSLVAAAGDDSCRGEASCGVLIAFVRADRHAVDSCDMGLEAEISDVQAVHLLSNVLTSATSPYLLGQTTDPSPPAIVSEGQGKWLAAVATATAVRVLRVTETDGTLSSEILLEISAAKAGEVALALAPEQNVLAVAYRDGCGNAAEVKVATVDLNTGSPAIIGSSSAPSTEAREARYPSLVWLGSPSDSYLLGWRESGGDQAFVAQVDGTGAILGTRIAAAAVDGSESSYYAGLLLRSDGNGGAVAYSPLRGGASGLIRTHPISCVGPN